MIGEYNKIQDKSARYNISPSSIASWFENPKYWYLSNIKKEVMFTDNTNTVFGTILHYAAEKYYDITEGKYSKTKLYDVVLGYLTTFNNNADVDEWWIRDNLDSHIAVLFEFLSTRDKPKLMEYPTGFKPRDNFFIGGTVDAVNGTTVTDYKTCSSFAKEIKIHHKFQLLLYAEALNRNGIDIDTIEIVQIKRGDIKGKVSEKTGKIIGIKKPEIKSIKQKITDDDRAWLKHHMRVLLDTLEVYDKHPELAAVLFRENPDSYIKI